MALARKPLSFANKPCYLKDGKLIVAKEEGTVNSVPVVAVIQSPKRCSDSLGVRVRRWSGKSDVKSPSLTRKLHRILFGSRVGGGTGMLGVAVKCVYISGTPVVKASPWTTPDTEARKLGE